MAIVGYQSIPGAQAGADLSSNQYKALRFDSTERQFVVISNANAQKPIGVQQDNPDASGQAIDIASSGMAKWECGGTVSYGDSLACNNAGEAISDAEVASSADLHHLGYALEAGVDGDIIDVMLHAFIHNT